MSEVNRYNLIDEAWIPTARGGRIGLRRLFAEPGHRALGGTPAQKIALTRLLLAIAQAAATPEDEAAWSRLGPEGLARACLAYLARWRDRFWLYGVNPFLQSPELADAGQNREQAKIPDHQRALQLVVLQTGGAARSHAGCLHCYLQTSSLVGTLWLNLLTRQQIRHLGFSGGPGRPPWEHLTVVEKPPRAASRLRTLSASLLPREQSCLWVGDHLVSGEAPPVLPDGVDQPSLVIDRSSGHDRPVPVGSSEQPWRRLRPLLAFLGGAGQKATTECWQLRLCLPRARARMAIVGVWFGGQEADVHPENPESLVMLETNLLGPAWYKEFHREMDALEELADILHNAVLSCHQAVGGDGREQADMAVQLFWRLAERDFQALLDVCGSGDGSGRHLLTLRERLAALVRNTYDNFCSRESGRHVDAWRRHRPDVGGGMAKEAGKRPQSSPVLPFLQAPANTRTG